MARKPRSRILFDGCTTHKVWRAHNKEWYLKDNDIKTLYLNCFPKGAKEESHKIQAICIMSNHVHEIYKIDKREDFSNFMRKHHSKFGMIYNKISKRSGKVAEDRPHTTCFETEAHSMEAVFYLHANPIKAGITKDERAYSWSTHMLYAFGKKPEILNNLTISLPSWYMNLGSNMQERQAKYRKLFHDYMEGVRTITVYKRFSKLLFIGSRDWEIVKTEGVKEYFRNLNQTAPP